MSAAISEHANRARRNGNRSLKSGCRLGAACHARLLSLPAAAGEEFRSSLSTRRSPATAGQRLVDEGGRAALCAQRYVFRITGRAMDDLVGLTDDAN